MDAGRLRGSTLADMDNVRAVVDAQTGLSSGVRGDRLRRDGEG